MSVNKKAEELKSNDEQELDLAEKARMARERKNRFPGTDEASIIYLEKMYNLSKDHFLQGEHSYTCEPRKKDESYPDFMARISKKHFGVKG